jgi:hypothetical protein
LRMTSSVGCVSPRAEESRSRISEVHEPCELTSARKQKETPCMA